MMKTNLYDGLTASAYLEREFGKNEKPADCTCPHYPQVKVRNGIGHPDDCPTWHRLAPAYYECKGYKFVSKDKEDRIVLTKLSESVFEDVSRRIADGTVTAADFDGLIEATDKSTNERVNRHVRVANPEPGNTNFVDRIVPKKQGRNDPPNQGRGRRYAAGKPARLRQTQKQKEMAEAIAYLLRHAGRTVLTESVDGVPALAEAVTTFLSDAAALGRLVEKSGIAVDRVWLEALSAELWHG